MLRNWQTKPRRVRPHPVPCAEATQDTIARTQWIASHINALIPGTACDIDDLTPASGNETIKSALRHVETYVYDEDHTRWRNTGNPNTLAMMFFESAIYDYLSPSHTYNDINDIITLIYAIGKQYLFVLKVSQLFDLIHVAHAEAGQGCCCTIPDGLSRCWQEVDNIHKPDQTQAALSGWIEQHKQPADGGESQDKSIPVKTLKRLKHIMDQKQSTISWSSFFGLRDEKTSRLYESISRKISLALTLYGHILKDTGTAKPYLIGTMVPREPSKLKELLPVLTQLQRMEMMRKDVPNADRFPRQNETQAADDPPRQPRPFSSAQTVARSPNACY